MLHSSYCYHPSLPPERRILSYGQMHAKLTLDECVPMHQGMMSEAIRIASQVISYAPVVFESGVQ